MNIHLDLSNLAIWTSTVLSSSGRLSSSSSAVFKIKSKKSKEVPLNILVNYKDNYNHEISEQKIVNLLMYSTGAAVAYGLAKPKGSFINIIFYIIIVLFLYQWYREWRRQKDIGEDSKLCSRDGCWKGLISLRRKILGSCQRSSRIISRSLSLNVIFCSI